MVLFLVFGRLVMLKNQHYRKEMSGLKYGILYYFTSDSKIWLDIARVGRCIFMSRSAIENAACKCNTHSPSQVQ
jgi:hypothetical protein